MTKEEISKMSTKDLLEKLKQYQEQFTKMIAISDPICFAEAELIQRELLHRGEN